ncbi:MAG TPA: L-seryl-tRNA(Sec) selenium transferase [Syntrophomonas sp.]|nr:L-seryl-tRNA(Sec) selenium transferase [Syntrophomonas sp.]
MTNLRNIPSIDELLAQPETRHLLAVYQREFIVDILRRAVSDVRTELRTSRQTIAKAEISQLVLQKADVFLKNTVRGSLNRVINATGVVLHTNLGRAPLADRAFQYMQATAQRYNDLEFDLAEGHRGSRYTHVEELLVRLTGAQAALVVNNNAAAVLLGLSTMAQGREVIVSRGQLIEIGGAFRIPEVMKASGAKLVEVGTTNRTYLRDYEAAITEDTALLFSAHTSNYKIMGFTAEAGLDELAALGQARGLPVMHDLGSGILVDLGEWGLKDEPTVPDSINSGADIITFSGDKLLGGPQAGIIVGKQKHIEAMKKNQLTRALRVDKLTIAALEGTLLEYLSGDPRQHIPVIRMLTLPLEQLRENAEELREKLEQTLDGNPQVSKLEVIALEDMVGGGAYPTYKLPGYGVQLALRGKSLEAAARALRMLEPALLTRRQEDALLLSVRTLLPGDQEEVAGLLAQVLQ